MKHPQCDDEWCCERCWGLVVDLKDDCSFGELWGGRLLASPHAPFVVSRGQSWSYQEFDQLVAATVERLDSLGVRSGEGLAIQGPNTPERIALHFAAQLRGLVTVPLLEGLTPTECARVIAHSGPSWVVTTPGGTALDTGTRVFQDDDNVVLDRHQRLTDNDIAEMHRIVDRGAGWIIYTSGSSGTPKGVVLPRQSFASCGVGYSTAFGVEADDRLLLCFPMGHAIGTHTIPSVALVKGASIALVERFSVSNFWRDVSDLKATTAILFPSQLTLLSDAAETAAGEAGDSPLRLVITHELHAAFAKRFPKVELATVWGMTETGVIGTGERGGQPGRQMNLVGKPMPVEGAEVSVIDEQGQPQSPGQPGEIAFRNPVGQMLEYFREPQLTSLTVVDRWVRSGDLGVLTADGLVFLGRLKNIIKRAGETIIADEIEHLLESHPAVFECSVCAVPDRTYTEEVGVVVFARPETDVESLRAWLQSQLATWKVPRYWLMIDDRLPRLENHKLARQAILAMLTGGESVIDVGDGRSVPTAGSH